MAIDVTLDTPASPEAVLAMIRSLDGGRGRAGRPSELSRVVTGMRVSARGDRFRVQLRRLLAPVGGDTLALEGRVVRAADGATRVVARCGTTSRVGWTVGVLVVLSVGMYLAGRGDAWLPTAIAVLVAAGAGVSNALVTPESDADAAYLVRRLEGAAATAAATTHA